MKPLSLYIIGSLFLNGLLFNPGVTSAQQSLPGNYTLQSGEVILNLKLSQQGNNLQGTLSGNTGASFQLSGQVENNIGYGTCSGAEGTVFFEAFAEGDDLTLSLIEPDAYGAPDYNQAQYLQFTKVKTSAAPSAAGAVTGALGLGGSNTSAGKQGTGNQTTSNQGIAATQAGQVAGDATVGENEVGDPSWGLKFGLPRGWVKRNTAEGAVVGHNTIAGMVLVIPHMAKTMQEMQTEMMQGMQEEGSYLMPEGGLTQFSQNVLSGEYAGIAEGTQVKAKGYGVLSPNGGGAYLIALTTPDKLGQELIGAAESMLNSVQYFKVDISGLMQHFAGTWSWHGTNSSSWMTFYPDGRFAEQSESSYSGDFTDGAGNYTGGWGAAGGDNDQGRWTVRGNKDNGTIIIRYENGNEVTYQYRVHVQDGHKYYREYYFNDYFYHKSD